MIPTNIYPVGTTEFQPLTVQVNGQAYTTYLTAITPFGQNTGPGTVWTPAYTLGQQHGILATFNTRGTYTIWARVTDAPEDVLINLGTIQVI